MKFKKKGGENNLREANISLVLNSYDDIFSDFDPRGYGEKALSDDFLSECKRASRDKIDDTIELRFLMPRNKRNIKDEELIKQRLSEHFKKHSTEKYKNIRSFKRQGFFWIFLGIIIIVTSVIVSFNFESTFFEAVLKIFEVPSWFLIWEGLGKIFIHAKDRLPEYEFYKKMSLANIGFFNY